MRQVQRAVLVAFASAASGALVLAFGDPVLPRWSPLATSDLAPPVLAAGAAVVLFLGVVLVASARRLGRRKQQITSVVGDLEVTTGEAPDSEAATDVRVLQAQIRTLEEALQQETVLVREPCLAPEAIREEAVEELLGRIRATVRGLGARMADDAAAATVLARVQAAVDRLVAPTAPFVRPSLTVARQVATLTTVEVPPFASTPVREIAVEEAGPEAPVLEAVYAAPALAPPVEEEVVLPIPARTQRPEVRGGRRWLRRSAA